MHQEPVAEEAAEDLDVQEEPVSASDPPRVIRADSAAGYDAVDVRMEMEILSPSVQHGKKADGGAQMLGVKSGVKDTYRQVKWPRRLQH